MDKPNSAGDPGAAITRVLNAEREARLAIENCAAQAEQLMSDARVRAREIVRLTQRRIGRLHKLGRSATEQRVIALEGGPPDSEFSSLPPAVMKTLLQQAAADAAATLTTRKEPQSVD